jgi:exodeoxyribonuclease V beta subunit
MQVVDLATHPLEGFSLIEASAGTGKTYTISHLFLRYLLETDYSVQQLLVVTFTNAATDELKHRIRRLIGGVLAYIEGRPLNDFDIDPYFQQWQANDKAIRSLQRALIDFDEASVFSINGFCQRMLTRFPLDTGSMLQQELIENQADLEIEAAQDFWRKRVLIQPGQELQWLQSQWKTPVDLLHLVKPLLRYRSSLETARAQIQEESTKVNCEVLWKQLAASWLKKRHDLQQVVFDNPNLAKLRHSTENLDLLKSSLEVVFNQSVCLELPNNWELLTYDRLHARLKKNHSDERLAWTFFKRAKQYQDLLRQRSITQRRSWLVEAALYIHDSVEQAKARTRQISFDDQIENLDRALQVSGEPLARKISLEYPVAMVDEFQDTDLQQYNIFKQVYLGLSKGSLILIGDPKQSIYSFRRADVFTYRRARDATEKQFTLETNYRSSEEFVEIINQLFGANPDAFIHSDLIRFHQARANARNPRSLTCNQETQAPLVCWLLPAGGKSLNKEDAQIALASICCDTIADLLSSGNLELDGKPVKASDLAILVKTGRQASLIQQQLAQRGIASALVSQESVFASPQAMDFFQWLSVLHNPGNTRLLFGLLLGKLFDWSSQRVAALQEDDEQLVDLLERFAGYRQRWMEQGVLAAFFAMLEDWKTVGRVLNGGDAIHGERRLTNWLHIADLLQQESAQHANEEQTLHWLQQQIDLARQGQTASDSHQLRLESDSRLVRIVTVHGSKGLQYPIVFLPFMWNVSSKMQKPSSYAYHDELGQRQVMIEDDSQLVRWQEEKRAEEIRLFYVALTRAQYRCYLGWGDISECALSAPAQLLYADLIDFSKFPYRLMLDSQQDLRAPFDAMNTQRTLVEIVDVDLASTAGRFRTTAIRPVFRQPPANKFERLLYQQWQVTSYSRMAASSDHGLLADLPDHDAVETTGLESETAIDSIETRFSFIKGAKAGNFIHDLLEVSDFTRHIDQEILRAKMDQHGIAQRFLPGLEQWLNETLIAPLDSFSLSSLAWPSTLREMEFMLHLNRLDVHRLNRLLAKQNYLAPGQELSFSEIQGYLKGFIDLVFEQDGRYYLLDYKTNYLGNDFSTYDLPSMQHAMEHHLYTLQFLIYTVALHRYLQQRIQDYDYQKHFGGVFYLFLRGMSPVQPGKGVYQHRPRVEFIQQLDGLFG